MPSTDKPDDDTINDDVALDAWYQQYIREMAIKSAQAKGQNSTRLPMNDKAKQRVIKQFGR